MYTRTRKTNITYSFSYVELRFDSLDNMCSINLDYLMVTENQKGEFQGHLSLISVVVLKHCPKPTGGGNDLVGLQVIVNNHQGTSRQELKHRYRGMLITTSPPLLPLISFFSIQPRTTSLGMPPPTVGQACQGQSAIKKITPQTGLQSSLRKANLYSKFYLLR